MDYNRIWPMSGGQIKDSMRVNSRWKLLTPAIIQPNRLEYGSPENDSVIIYWLYNDKPWKISLSHARQQNPSEPQGTEGPSGENTWYDTYNNVKTVRRHSSNKTVEEEFEPLR